MVHPEDGSFLGSRRTGWPIVSTCRTHLRCSDGDRMRAITAANVRRLRLRLGAAVVGGALLSVSPATPATSAEFVATADSFVSAARPTSNYGGLPLMLASASPSMTMYLRFDVSGIAEGSTAI